MAVLQTGLAKSLAEDYTIDQSLRFDDGDSAYLERTFTSAGNQTTWTYSGWVKLGGIDTGLHQTLLAEFTDSNASFFVGFLNSNVIEVWGEVSNSTLCQLDTTAKYRDPGAWLHVVVAFDTGNATEADRVRIYVNGDRVTDFTTETTVSTQDQEGSVNSANPHRIGQYNSNNYLDSYLAEVYFIDGQALDPDSFAETDSTTNQWKPIDASGLTFGTNGFYQKYAATELANSFTDSSAVFTPTEDITVDYLLIAGGGGGGAMHPDGGNGAGGAGGMLSATSLSLASETIYAIIVGDGGAGGYSGSSPYNVAGTSGTDSSISGAGLTTITATGGGGGGTDNSGPSNGGSGGGAMKSRTPGTGVAGQGNAGGAGYTDGATFDNGGGGGGKGAVGGAADSSSGGTGGAGATNDYRTGSDVTYAGGGGGGGYTGKSAGAGGSGGGGAGSVGSAAATSGTANTGGGGGGGSRGGNGGRGIAVIRYISTTEKATGGTITSYVDGSDTYQVHSFTLGGHEITPEGDVANTRAQKKVGTSSIAFDGTGDYLEIPASSDWKFGTGAYTVEMWFYTAATTQGYFYVCNNLGTISPNWQGLGIEIRASSNSSTVYVNEQVANTDHYFESTTTGLNDGAWHHMAVSRESAGDAKLFIDGTHEATQDDNYDFDSGGVVNIGRQNWGPGGYFNGYIDEIRVSDTARYTTTFTPQTTQFTADANTVLLIHSDFDGGLGADSSGNANDFAVTNLVATDQMVDSPTNNFATLNPLVMSYDSPNYSEGNLEVTGAYANSSYGNAAGTITVSSGKWYWEDYNKSSFYPAYSNRIGIKSDTALSSDAVNPQDHTGTIIYISDGNKRIDGVDTSYGASYTDGDIIGVALDLDSGTQTITFYKNGSSQGAITISGGCSTAASLAPVCIPLLTRDVQLFNFGQDSSFAGNVTAQGNQDSNNIGDFYYEPPTDYLALCTSNLPDPEITLPGDNFNTVIYDDGAGAKTGVGFQPDLVWVKSRGSTYEHEWTDAVRGVTKALSSDSSNAETTDSTGLTAFGTDGFTVGADTNYSDTTGSGMVAWNWLGANGTVTNTDGTNIDSEVSANPTAGFSICTYTGTGTNDDSFGHGLASAPELVIVKRREDASWQVGSTYIQASDNWTHYLELDTTGASDDSNIRWNDTAPSASVVTLGTTTNVNGDGATYVAYCFHSVEGYSKIGGYTGNASSDGPFLYTGFRPAFFVTKNLIATNQGWITLDSVRSNFNSTNLSAGKLDPSNTAIESDNSIYAMDFVSNGVKLIGTDGGINVAQDYLYIAIAEFPFKYANSR